MVLKAVNIRLNYHSFYIVNYKNLYRGKIIGCVISYNSEILIESSSLKTFIILEVPHKISEGLTLQV